MKPSIATSKGHISQERQKLRSTKEKNLNYNEYIKRIKQNIERMKKQFNAKENKNKNFTDVIMRDVLHDAFPVSDKPNVKTHEVLYSMFESDKELGYMDLTGRFPYKSSRGNEYIMVAYCYDGNTILAQPLKNREEKSIVDAWRTINKRLTKAGLKPKKLYVR